MKTFYEVKKLHAIYYIGAAGAVQTYFARGGADTLNALAKLDRDRNQIEHALEWLVTGRGKELGILLNFMINSIAEVAPLRYPCRKLLSWYAADRRAAHSRNDRKEEIMALGRLATLHIQLEELALAIQILQECLVFHQEVGDKRHEFADLTNLGIAYATLQQYPTANKYLVQAKVLCGELRNPELEGSVLCNLGTIQREMGNVGTALNYYRQSLAIARKSENWLLSARDLVGIATCCYLEHNTPEAIKKLKLSLRLYRRIGEKRGEGDALWNLALIHDKSGGRTQAVVCAQAALRLTVAESATASKIRAQLAAWRKLPCEHS